MITQLTEKTKEIVKTLFDKEVEVTIDIPTVKVYGDYAINIALPLAKQVGQNPLHIADQISAQLGSLDFIDHIEVVKPGFINIFVKTASVVGQTLTAIQTNTLIPQLATKDKVIVEHTSVNPNKALHIGHLRNSILGDSIGRLLRRVGYQVEIHNYIDDTGVQVADTVNGLLNLDMKQPEGQKFDDYCWDVYTEINKAYESRQDLQEKRKEILHEIEHSEGELAKQANQIVEKILACHLELLASFDINYDLLVYESDIIGFGFWETAFEKLKNSPNFVYETEGTNAGCWILKYDSPQFGDKIFVRSNGTKVYTAKDTAYHLWKFGLLGKDFLYRPFDTNITPAWRTSAEGTVQDHFGNADKIINVIDERQTYPQEMVKHALHSLGYTQAAEHYVHIAYGVVALSKDTATALGIDTSDNKGSYAMSGRKGIGVKVTDLLKLIENEVAKIQAESKFSDTATATRTTKDIALGAIKHYMLKNNPNSEVLFDYAQATQLTGNTGPYLQYSHARAKNILAKAGDFQRVQNFAGNLSETERDLVKKLSELPTTLTATLEDFNMALLAEYAFMLSKAFHAFYEHNNVMQAETETKTFRLSLVEAYTLVIKEVLDILGIAAPEKM